MVLYLLGWMTVGKKWWPRVGPGPAESRSLAALGQFWATPFFLLPSGRARIGPLLTFKHDLTAPKNGSQGEGCGYKRSVLFLRSDPLSPPPANSPCLNRFLVATSFFRVADSQSGLKRVALPQYQTGVQKQDRRREKKSAGGRGTTAKHKFV